MSRKQPLSVDIWLTGLALALVTLLGPQKAQAQEGSVLPSFSGQTDPAAPYARLTYSGDLPYGFTAVADKPCEPHMSVPGPRKPNPNRGKHPKKAKPNSGKRNPGNPCEQQPLAKGRHRWHGKRV